MMTYQEAMDFINHIPHIGKRNGVNRVRPLLEKLGNPQQHLRFVHVAGTNGKGSTVTMTASVLRQDGLRVGMFISPYVEDFRERIQLDGQWISKEDLAEEVSTLAPLFRQLQQEDRAVTEFEFDTAMALHYFARKKCDMVVLEVGMGGKLDATNCIDAPDVSAIASISFDHTQYLGNTLAEIAGEKAGIIKPGVPVIYDGHCREASEVIRSRAEELGSPAYELLPSMYRRETVSQEGITFTFDCQGAEPVTLQIPYIADYQMMNASLAYFTMQCLREIHGISEEGLTQGIAKAHWPCRMETVLPGVIIDGAHNEDGIEQFIRTAAHFAREREITILFSAVCDKKYEEMIRKISEGIRPARVVATQIEGSREVPAEELAEDFRKAGCREVYAQADPAQAFEQAYAMKGDGMLFCVGSLYLAGELKDHISKRAKEEKNAQL